MTRSMEGAVLAVFNAFFDNIRARRASENLTLYSGDEDCCLIGSDRGEETYGMAALAEFFRSADSRPSPFDFQWSSTRCTVSGDTGWVFAKGAVSGGGLAAAIPYLLTCIFVRRGEAWRIRHFHGSEPR